VGGALAKLSEYPSVADTVGGASRSMCSRYRLSHSQLPDCTIGGVHLQLTPITVKRNWIARMPDVPRLTGAERDRGGFPMAGMIGRDMETELMIRHFSGKGFGSSLKREGAESQFGSWR